MDRARLTGLPKPRVPIAGIASAKAEKVVGYPVTSPVKTPEAVRILDFALQALPHPNIQQIAYAVEVPFDPFAWTYDAQILPWPFLTVPEGVTYILTDVLFYGLRAGIDPGAALIQLEEYQLSGAFLFSLSIAGTLKMRVESQPAEIYTTAPLGQQLTRHSGWGKLNVHFGAERTVPFALYAKPEQEIVLTMQLTRISQLPRFNLAKIGCEAHGISISATALDAIIQAITSKGR